MGEPVVVKALARCTAAVRRSFLRESHALLMEFLRVLNESAFMNSRLSSNLSCFFARYAAPRRRGRMRLSYFAVWLPSTKSVGRLTAVEAEGSCNEFQVILGGVASAEIAG